METTIKAGNSSAVIESKGAELKSLVLDGKELMWGADPAFWGKTSPVLFPIVGGVRGGKTLIDGIEYSMTKHGFARDYEFEGVVCSAESRHTVSFVLHENSDTLKMFPFRFTFTMRYTLTESKLEILYEVANNSDVPMPYCIGAHPAFACPNSEGMSFDDHTLVFQEKETVCSPVLDCKTRLFKSQGGVWRLKNSRECPLSYSLFDNDVLYFRNIVSKNVSLLDKENHGIKVSWDGFNSLGVWTPAGMKAGFVCIEPWCGCDDFDDCTGNFRDKPEIQTCLPGASKYYVLTVERV
ncbi:MAG: aldose 1-epimerase family protein [Ruminococcaceae bacterium]|nr:aldose 1-epimerase family protein [Oscillospiraceae bacterium]